MPTILNRFPVKAISTSLIVAVFVSLFQGCNKNAETVSPKKIESDTTIVFGIDSSSLSENLTADELGIFDKVEDTTGIPFSDLLLPNGDTLINYLSKDFLNQYPLSLRRINSHQGMLRGSGYKPKDDQISAFNILIAQITGKAQYIKTLRGKPLFPAEGSNNPEQVKIGYASGGIKEYLSKGKLIRKEISGKNFNIRSFTPGCTDSIYALNSSGFMSTIFDVDGVKNFPFTLSAQANSTILMSSLPDGLDKNKFELIDMGVNLPKNEILTGDIVSFYYNNSPVPNHIGFSAKGHNDNLQLYHSIGSSLSCSNNESLLSGPISWNMNKLNESNLAGSKGNIKYQVKRIRYIAELELLPSVIDSTPGAVNAIQMKVYSSDDLPVKDNLEVQFTSSDGTITSSALTKNGMVQANWQLANRSGLQSCTAIIKSPIDNTTILDQVVLSLKVRGVPMLNSIDTSFIAKTIATIKASVRDNGGSAITEKGICYGTHPDVSISDNTIQTVNVADSFALNLPGLTKNTTYYARSYAKNASGIGYSDEISFTTLSDADDPYDLSGIWSGQHLDSAGWDIVGYTIQMSVAIKADQFSGLVTSDISPGPGTTFKGVVSQDGTQLTLLPFANIVFENPWTINGNKISGTLYRNFSTSGEMRSRYNLTKQ